MNHYDDRPASSLVDLHGRRVRYLRLSVTDRCNLRCLYCWGGGGMRFIPHDDILRYEEMARLVDVAVESGVEKVRLTGGEPLVRKNVLHLVELVRKKHPAIDLRITTNGTLLESHVAGLRDLGVSTVNVSLDTFRREVFHEVTGRDFLPQVMAGMEAVLAAGLSLKVNAVALRGVTDGELATFVDFARNHRVDVRFIEFMPMGEGSIWSKDLFWSASDILAEAGRHWTLEPYRPCRFTGPLAEESGPAELWKLRDAQGRTSRGSFGLITSVTHGFCASCNRPRLTAEGSLRTCLYDDKEFPVRDLLRSEGPEAVRRVMLEAVAQKPVGSEILARSRGPVAHKRMSAIGG